MAEGRMLLGSIAYDERLAQLSVASEYLYLKAIPHLDEGGRMRGSPMFVRGTAVPARAETEGWSDEDVRQLMLEWLGTVDGFGQPRPLVKWGRGPEGVEVLEFPGFAKSQKLRRKGTSRLPAPQIPVAEYPSAPTLFDDARFKGSEEKGSEEEEAAYAAVVHELDDRIRDVYDHWRREREKTHPRFDAVSDARRKKISTRLSEFTVDELKQAISAVALDPWDDRPRHDDLTVILRSREQVERFLALAENGSSLRSTRKGGLSASEILALTKAAP